MLRQILPLRGAALETLVNCRATLTPALSPFRGEGEEGWQKFAAIELEEAFRESWIEFGRGGSQNISIPATIGFAEGGAGDSKAKAKTAIERVFSPEFRNRLDAIVTFLPLTPAAMLGGGMMIRRSACPSG